MSATTNTIIALADQLAGAGIERVVVESTSDYWRPFVYLFQARGLTAWLVNARDVKQVPGRPKTDKIDAVWLAKPQRAGHAESAWDPQRLLTLETRMEHDIEWCAGQAAEVSG